MWPGLKIHDIFIDKSIEIPTSFRLSYSQAMIALGLSSESTFSHALLYSHRPGKRSLAELRSISTAADSVSEPSAPVESHGTTQPFGIDSDAQYIRASSCCQCTCFSPLLCVRLMFMAYATLSF